MIKLNPREVICFSFALCALLIFSQNLRAQEINLEDKLILHLPMNGNAEDESTMNTPTLIEGPVLTIDRFGNNDKAYLFNGISDKINLNNNQALITSKQFAICVWARIDGRTSGRLGTNALFEQRDDGSINPVAIVLSAETDQETRMFIRSSEVNTTHVIKTEYPGDGEWHFYVGMIDEDKNIQIYIDGQLEANGNLNNDGDFHTGINRVNIGSHHPGGEMTGAFNGAIGEVHIYNRALKPCEIEALYSGQLMEER